MSWARASRAQQQYNQHSKLQQSMHQRFSSGLPALVTTVEKRLQLYDSLNDDAICKENCRDQITPATDRPSSRLVILMSYLLTCYSWVDFNPAAYFLNHILATFITVLSRIRSLMCWGGEQKSDCAPGGTAAPDSLRRKLAFLLFSLFSSDLTLLKVLQN